MKSRIVIFSLAVALCVSSSAIASAMSSTDFRGNVVGKTWKWKIQDVTGTIAFLPSGSVEANLTGKYELELTGIWRWKNDQICIKYNPPVQDKESCADIAPNSRGYSMSTGGQLF